MKTKFYYLFGQQISKAYYDQPFDEVLRMIQEETLDIAVHVHAVGEEHPSELLAAADGWMGFAEISRDEYKQIEKLLIEKAIHNLRTAR